METFRETFEAQRRAGRILSYRKRRSMVEALQKAILEWRPQFAKAIEKDLRRSPEETDIAEFVTAQIIFRHVKRNLRGWMQPKRVSSSVEIFGSKSWIRYEPKGVVLLISPWNYPFYLTIGPLVEALAAGNRVVIKPSELTPNTSDILKQCIESTFRPDEVAVFTGGREVSAKLLELPFDHFFVTGGPNVGRAVMAAAAKNLVPVTLELGGKSPVFVDKTANFEHLAKHLIWAKKLNSGQTCLAPDYILLQKGLEDRLLGELRRAIEPMGGTGPLPIVNEGHFNRLVGMLEGSLKMGAEVGLGGRFDKADKSIELTVLKNVRPDHPIMREEIFGPLLPIVSVDSLDQAISICNSGEKPLALYIFSSDRSVIDKIQDETQSGGTCINELMVHISNPYLPFGGIGGSGMGYYHGEFGFNTFSHQRAVVERGYLNFTWLSYPPISNRMKQILNYFLRPRS